MKQEFSVPKLAALLRTETDAYLLLELLRWGGDGRPGGVPEVRRGRPSVLPEPGERRAAARPAPASRPSGASGSAATAARSTAC